MRVGKDARLGRYVMLRDAYGNTYTYGHLARPPAACSSPRSAPPAQVGARRPLADAAARPRPDAAGQRRRHRRSAPPPRRPQPARAPPEPRPPRPPRQACQGAPVRQPGAPPRAALGRAPADPRCDLRAARLGEPALLLRRRRRPRARRARAQAPVPGRRVIAGTILGRIGAGTNGREASHMLFEIRPPGADAPRSILNPSSRAGACSSRARCTARTRHPLSRAARSARSCS